MNVLAIDCGTQSLRAIVFSHEGEMLVKEKVEFEPYYSLDVGWAEQNPNVFWNALCSATNKLAKDYPVIFDSIQGVTLTTQRATVVVVDERGEPLRDAFIWLDEREAKGKPKLTFWENLAFSLIGKKPTAHMAWRRSKANYMRIYEPEIWKRVHKYLLLSGYLTYKLTGEFVDSKASQVGYIPFDYKRKDWISNPRHYRWHLFGIDRNMLPNLVEPTRLIGYVSEQASKETGLKKGLPVIAAGADKQCETLAVGCFSPEVASISLGTTATIQTTTDKYIEPLPFMPSYPSVVPGKYNPEIEVFRGYWLISWFKKEFAHHEVREAEMLGTTAEELLNQRLKNIPAGSEGLMLQPTWTAGLDKPFSRGAIIGFSDKHTRIHIYRAIIEGINYALIEGVKSIEKKTKVKIKRIGLSGGGATSDEISQITANMFGVPTYKVQTNETSALGAAIAAFIGLGVYNSVEEAVKNMVHIQKEFYPDMNEHEVYLEYYRKVYLRIWEALGDLYKELDSISRKSKKI
ncbi:FGGY-family carbohydrate kinase [Fervidobacterium sp. 2310opik-2]|uniref:FGGY-family carbohydrate kinase n=1 Tax=Fervidobacterium sp. 2310opik-2 TaxID=1755815 RepID=UPI0013E06825|nr:FGGY-family carbohydrate kinase [Fervidobacterium sp. 2310opik-2]KAF2960933.1 carbohydrate kinase [Fervidobacterium sp. 2310opik-2]